MDEFSVIVVAGGTGSRLGAAVPKAFVSLADEPLVLHSVRAFEGIDGISRLIVVLPPDSMSILFGTSEPVAISPRGKQDHAFALALKEHGVTHVVAGGERRQDSVWNGLRAAGDADWVLVHDAARPLLPRLDILRVMNRARETGAAILARPLRDTLKRVDQDGWIESTVDRDNLWCAQTPQAFRRRDLLAACEQHNAQNVTDDAALAALAGIPCAIVEGSPRNLKITTVEDLALAELLLRSDSDRHPTGTLFRALGKGDTLVDLKPVPAPRQS
jgi:2-C-methyl-D-erythritol 4-phosphate cytidylyltransferase